MLVNCFVDKHLCYRTVTPPFNTKIVNFLRNKIKIRVQYDGQGVIKYSFKFLWKNVQVKKKIEEGILKKAITVATIVEEDITYGAGDTNDAQSIGMAASAYSSVVSGLVMCMV